MVERLIEERKDKIKHKDFCIEESNNNGMTPADERYHDDPMAEIDDVTRQQTGVALRKDCFVQHSFEFVELISIVFHFFPYGWSLAIMACALMHGFQ